MGVDDGGERTLVEVDAYLDAQYGPAAVRTLAETESFTYDNRTARVASVANTSATIAWNAPRTVTVDVANEGNVTLGDRTYLAHFPDNSTLQLTTDFESYRAQTEEIDTFHTHESGLWGVSILSFLTAVFLIGLAYMPSRY